MHRGGLRSAFLFLFALLGTSTLGCASEEYPLPLYELQHPATADASASGAGGSTPADAGAPGPQTCTQARGESLPARLVTMTAQSPTPGSSAPAAPPANVVLASDLFQTFNETCNPCHTAAADPPGQGGFQIIQAADFPRLMTAAVLEHVTQAVCPTNPDPSSAVDPMPPCSSPDGRTFSKRSATDPIVQFATLTAEWIQAGSPSSFTPPTDAGAPASTGSDGGDAGTAPSYAMTPQVGNAMTNIGNCIPSPSLMGVEDAVGMAKDAMFAGLSAADGGTAAQIIGLPEHIGDTDLVTLESEQLARYGVIAYAPGYPLWSDGSGKLRHVRVPRGQSIHFNKATQQFEIPPNTRFYKTFMKEIADTDGSYRYRKIETRLIVSRPDQNGPDGAAIAQTALFGSYRWNADESDATLVETPLNDGLPFADTLFYYNTDEQLAADVLQSQPTEPEESLELYGAIRHYAIPGSPRCVQCHMGSPSQSFVLGFTPLQINRRPVGVGGVIPPAVGLDELTQLQRLIDAGVITGIDSPSDVLPLEQSQCGRVPRNDYELTAQGYMLGNCAHCHNPRGYPTVQNPVLQGVLDFLPSAAGGIFQFPLDRYSPRIGRGLTGATPIPYITPSLVDLPKLDPASGEPAGDWFTNGSGPDGIYFVDYAPWRSIIYRNVDAAFAYTDDNALFPHMPMNTAGYDPRAKQILGDWMVSIPAIRQHPEIPEYAYQTDSRPEDNIGGPTVDTSPQPYVEVRPGDPRYDAAVSAAQQRLAVLHTGANPAVKLGPGGITYSRYADPGQTQDIIDPDVVADPICHPVPVGNETLYLNPLPEHPHWVPTDLTLPPGPWTPRQPNWTTVLVEQQIPPPSGGCTTLAGEQAAYADQIAAVHMLPSVTLAQISDFATTAQPFGLWSQNTGPQDKGCTFPSSVPLAGSFTGAQRPHWMDVANVADNAPVYMQTPGASVFKMICINCHGPNADANGRLAQNLATMTGGNALVANFRAGLFGPPGATDANNNRSQIFSAAVVESLTNDAGAPPGPDWLGMDENGTGQVGVDDRAARYMAWMGLGGTSVNIPVAVLDIVAITKVLNELRTLDVSQLSANMLSQAKALCLSMMGPGNAQAAVAYFDPTPGHGYLDAKLSYLNTTLIPSNGDAELWLQVCTTANPPPVHILRFGVEGTTLHVSPMQDSTNTFKIPPDSMLPASVYPAGAAVGNERGAVDPSLVSTNEWPWCVDDTGAKSDQEAYLSSNNLPICPSQVKAASAACVLSTTGVGCFENDQANQWAVRGAINAGFSVFTYVRSIENTGPPPDFNQCSLVSTSVPSIENTGPVPDSNHCSPVQ
jgi:mono/diheme cytochrome c family protein